MSPNFIHIHIEKDILIKEILSSILSNASNLWKNNIHFYNEKKDIVIIEFSSPNIAKPFHAGHMRSTILGNSIANIYHSVGYKVIRLNYIGDWGSQFGVLSKGYEIFGNDNSLKENPILHLFEVYVKANSFIQSNPTFLHETRQEFKRLEDGHQKTRLQWQKFRDLSMTDLKDTYERLRIAFDLYESESMFTNDAILECDRLKNMGLLDTKDDGSEVIRTNHPSGQKEIILKKSDGTTLYLTRDIAAAKIRHDKYKFGKMLYVVENGQSDHFIALFDIIKQMGFSWYKNLLHVKFGRIHGMSTRRGNVVFLKDILDEAKTRTLAAMQQSPTTKVKENLDSVADILGVSAVIVNDMSARRLNDYHFDWNRVIHMKGNSGISLQYVHARLWSLEEACGTRLDDNYDVSLLKETEALDLVSTLARYEEVCYRAYIDLEPCYIVNYLFQLCHVINKAFKALRVKGESEEVAKVRLLLFVGSRHVLADGMKTIGLHPLRKM